MHWVRANGASLAAWIAASLCLAWAMVRTLGLESGFPLAALISWTPYVVPVAVIVTAFALVIRRWGPAAVGATAIVLLVAAVAPRAFGGGYEPDGADGPELRVMSANLKLGKADPAEVLAIVRESGMDVLCAQELTPELANVLEASGLDELLPHSLERAGPSSTGSAIFSRYPLHPLGGAEAPGYPFVMPRAMVAVPGAGRIEVASVHTVPPTGSSAVNTWEQGLDQLPDAGESGRPTLLIGDFNATLDHEAFRDVLDRGYVDAGDVTGAGLEPTWPQDKFRPWVTIDHVLADERIAIADYDVLGLPGSDHHAITATLGLPAE
jgi:endonuclease/exonuclease/phosphatase family metal-dependent hydrolase